MSLDMSGPIEHFKVVVYQELSIGPLDISISNTAFFMMLAVVLAFLVLKMSVLKTRLIPHAPQLLVEMFYAFIAKQTRLNIAEHGERFIPLMFCLFTFILSCNLVGLIPGAFTPTSQLAVTGTLAVGVFLYAISLRFSLHGWGFFRAFSPKSIPNVLLPVMIPIELISFLARPLTLALRLFANMTAGHMALGVLAILGLATPWFLQWLPMGFTVIQIALELMIAFIQAYIFFILSCVYIDDALAEH